MKYLLVTLILGIVIAGYFNFQRITSSPSNLNQIIPVNKINKIIPHDPVVAAAGDIACSTELETDRQCKQNQTADLIGQIKPDLVLALGDLQYDNQDLNKYYENSWGKFKYITKVAPGNHDDDSSPSATLSYFNDQDHYYSFNLGTWHLIALDSNCGGGCSTGSAQQKWLEQDLSANKMSCTLVYFHHPLFSSGMHGNNLFMKDLWQTLYNHHADLVLNGHDHIYERFAPQDSNGKVTPDGIREFIVGTGGRNLYTFNTLAANSEIKNNQTFGVLKLTLHDKNYDYQFVPIAGSSFTDQGTGSCHT